MAFRLFRVDDAAIDGRTDAYRTVETVFADQFPPSILQVDFVAGNDRQAVRIVYAVGEKEYAIDLVPAAQDGLGEAQRRAGGFAGIGRGMDDDGENQDLEFLPSAGSVEIDGVDISRMNENQLTDIRNQKIGFVFQFFNLIPTLTAVENVALPIEFAQMRRHQPFSRARDLLDMLGLGDRFNHKPNELSGGQQQRVAIARALANDPPILLADEPTGNLDTESGETVMAALNSIRAENGTTIVLVTHDRSLANRMDRVLLLEDGIISADGAEQG